MIFRDAIFGKTEGVTVMEFGTGDILMINSKDKKSGHTALAFKTRDTPKPIGYTEDLSIGTYDEMKPEVVMVFRKKESIQATIEMLQELKELM